MSETVFFNLLLTTHPFWDKQITFFLSIRRQPYRRPAVDIGIPYILPKQQYTSVSQRCPGNTSIHDQRFGGCRSWEGIIYMDILHLLLWFQFTPERIPDPTKLHSPQFIPRALRTHENLQFVPEGPLGPRLKNTGLLQMTNNAS